MGSSGSNGDSVPKAIENPVFLLEVIQTTLVPALTQKNWLPFASGTLGFTDALPPDFLISILQDWVAEPQVLAAVHKSCGFGSSQAYLLLACDMVPPSKRIEAVTAILRKHRFLIIADTFQDFFVSALQRPNERADYFSLAPAGHITMLLSFQGFILRSNCGSPSLLMVSWVAGKRTPPLFFLSWSLMMISPAVKSNDRDWVS